MWLLLTEQRPFEKAELAGWFSRRTSGLFAEILSAVGLKIIVTTLPGLTSFTGLFAISLQVLMGRKSELTEYEKRREEVVSRNRAMFAQFKVI
jgi:hypothetical protein